MDERVDGYLIKYALTEGIRKVDGAELAQDGKYVVDRRPQAEGYLNFFVKNGGDFVLTRGEAEKMAREKAMRKIKCLEKQIAKLRVLAGTPKWAKEPR